jgi:LmeA-like phospholipid-binding
VRRLALLAAAGGVLLLLVVAQLVLPGLAAQRLRDRLNRSGQVLHVEVSAFPAIELLWHHADRVVVRMGRYQAAPGHLGSLLAQAGDAGSLDASATELHSGLLTLRDATLHKRGDELSATANVTESDLRAALPVLDSVVPVASGGGQLTLRGTATILGVSATVDATVAASGGQVVVAPNVPFGGLATITVFSNPRLYVQGVSGAPAASGFSVYAQGRLR